LDKDLLVKFS